MDTLFLDRRPLLWYEFPGVGVNIAEHELEQEGFGSTGHFLCLPGQQETPASYAPGQIVCVPCR